MAATVKQSAMCAAEALSDGGTAVDGDLSAGLQEHHSNRASRGFRAGTPTQGGPA